MPPAATAATSGAAGPGTREVLVVSNNWEGTADLLDGRTYQRLRRLDIVPDRREREAEIARNPDQLAYYLGIRQQVGEGHDQLVDDAFTSRDGRTLYVSRPSFADVVALDIASGRIVWRTRVAGYRSDHMAVSADGRTLLVSASTANVVHALDTASGRIVGGWQSGDQPHENTYSRDGSRIFHASIGTVFTPTDRPLVDASKGERVFQVVDARTYRVLESVDMGQKLAEFGRPDMSGAVRPVTFSPDERYAYLQVSFHHGFVVYDMRARKVVRVVDLPVTESGRVPREQYLLDSAHHGIAMQPSGERLCVAGTMSDYAAIVRPDGSDVRRTDGVTKPYWATNAVNGRDCVVSISGRDAVSIISYATGREVARVPVGDHPQRVRAGSVRCELLPTADCVAPRIRSAKVRRAGPRDRASVHYVLHVRLSEAATVRYRETRRSRTGRTVTTARRARRLPAGRSAVRLPRRVRLSGMRTMRLRAVDRAGNASTVRRTRYKVRYPRR